LSFVGQKRKSFYECESDNRGEGEKKYTFDIKKHRIEAHNIE